MIVQTSQALLTSSSVRIRDQSLTAISNNLYSQQITDDIYIGDTDYTSFNEVIVLQANANGFMYDVTIKSNPEAEPIETFNAILSYESGGVLTVTQDTATVQIYDVDGK